LKRDVNNVFLAGIATNRTVVFYNGVTNSSLPWQLSSCSRRDYQCSFQPLSGCVLTSEEIIRAHNVGHDEFSQFVHGRRKQPYADSKVVRYADPGKRRISATGRVLGQLHRIANLIIDELDPADGRVPILRKAAQDIILSKLDARSRSGMLHETSDFDISFILFMLRPTLEKGTQLKAFMENDIPPDFKSAQSFGLPIRGSDKCRQESECLQFPTYMRLLKSKWYEEGFAEKYGQGNGNVTIDVLITSEMKDIMDQAHAFSNNAKYMSKFPFTPRWITNTNDIRQGSGYGNFFVENEKDDITTSILSSFKLQMNARSTIGNCCSNFHQIIMQLLQGGCGVENDNKGQCLQSRNESMYQLCCSRRTNPRCVRDRLTGIRNQLKDINITQEEAEMRIWDDL